MIIRATQKKMMSKPVTSADEGRNSFSSGVSAGQPRVLKGTSAELNHVSSTSGSRASGPASPAWAASAWASAALRAT